MEAPEARWDRVVGRVAQILELLIVVAFVGAIVLAVATKASMWGIGVLASFTVFTVDRAYGRTRRR